MKQHLLQKDPLWPPLAAELAQRYTVARLYEQADPDQFLQEHGQAFEAMVSTSRFGFDQALLERLQNLRAISNFGVGLDRLDLSSVRRHGIQVGYTPDVLTDCVADMAFGLILSACRRITCADRFVRQGAWPAGSFPLGQRVCGKRLGIVGYGRIGSAVAARAAGFHMAVGYVNRTPRDGVAHRHFATVRDLAAWCDILVVTVSGDAGNQSLIDGQVLAALGPEGVLVNIARGNVVDEAALLDALETGAIAAAALDVFPDEPHVAPRLMALDNAVLTPHIASSTRETRHAMADLVLANLEAYFKGEPMVAPVPQ